MESGSVDLSEFFKYSRPKKRPCPIAFINSQLKERERQQLRAASQESNGIITGGAIAEWLKARGHDVSVPAITAHRKGVCSCADS